MTPLVSELEVVFGLLLRLVRQSDTESNVYSDEKCLDKVLLFLERLFQHCWALTSGPQNYNTLTGKCLQRSAAAFPLPSSENISQLETKECVEHYSSILDKVPRHYSLMMLPLLSIRILITMLETNQFEHVILKGAFCSRLLNSLIHHKAYCEAETLMTSWLENILRGDSISLRLRKFGFPDLDRRAKSWVRSQLKEHLQSHPFSIFAWMHPGIVTLFVDEPFDPMLPIPHLVAGSEDLMSCVLARMEDFSVTMIEGVPIPAIYDSLARELVERVRSIWLQSKTRTSIAAKQRLDYYILSMTKLVSRFALNNHPELLIVAIEMAILAMICIGMEHDSVSPIQLLSHTGCHACERSTSSKETHNQLACLLQELYSAQDGVTLQSITDSPESSPLLALSGDGLDLGHTFMLVAKEMQWHDIALPEAQALSVCSEWMTASGMPFTDDFFKKLSSLQIDAENRALKAMHRNGSVLQSNYIYDDIVDAWVPPESYTLNVVKEDKENRCYPKEVQPTTLRRKRKLTCAPKTDLLDIPPMTQDDDEIDFLGVQNMQHAPRVCRKVQRLDVRQEALRQKQRRKTRPSLLPYL